MADRGLYTRWLFQAICACGWHPFLRINLGVKARLVGEETFDWIGRWTPTPGTCWNGEVECFAGKASRLTCTLLMHWEEGYEHAWAILTDLASEEAEVSWYGMRAWVETGYKDIKRGLWGWHHSKMVTASRIERLWLALAVAQVWSVSVGCLAEAEQQQESRGQQLPAQHIARRRRKRPVDQPAPRRLSCVVRGRLGLVAALFTAQCLPCGRLVPLPWPQMIMAPTATSEKVEPSASRSKDRGPPLYGSILLLSAVVLLPYLAGQIVVGWLVRLSLPCMLEKSQHAPQANSGDKYGSSTRKLPQSAQLRRRERKQEQKRRARARARAAA